MFSTVLYMTTTQQPIGTVTTKKGQVRTATRTAMGTVVYVNKDGRLGGPVPWMTSKTFKAAEVDL